MMNNIRIRISWQHNIGREALVSSSQSIEKRIKRIRRKRFKISQKHEEEDTRCATLAPDFCQQRTDAFELQSQGV